MSTAINFPDSPSLNDTYIYGTITFKYNGTNWYVITPSIIPISDGKILIGDASNEATERDFSVKYADINSELKSKGTVTGTVNLSTYGIGEITLSANTAFTFSGYELNKEYLLIIIPNGFTPSFLTAARHIILDGSAEFDDATTVYVSLRCINNTPSSEKLITVIGKEIS